MGGVKNFPPWQEYTEGGGKKPLFPSPKMGSRKLTAS